tara:strand:+ start:244 stop:879 length:636 start_codon:yes stop_codon:yes gene_type:complete
MNDYWKGLIEYSEKRDREEKMKETLKEFGSIFAEIITTVVIIILITHAALFAFSYSVLADEALTPDERVVTLTLLGEARGEGLTGIYAVGCVVQKRSSNRSLTPAQVCQQSWQFSIWNAGKGKIKKESELWYLYESPSASYARQLARKICAGRKLSQDYTGNADHYYSHKIMKQPPYWAFKIEKDKNGKVIAKEPIKPSKVIGNHTFYKLR